MGALMDTSEASEEIVKAGCFVAVVMIVGFAVALIWGIVTDNFEPGPFFTDLWRH